MAVRGSDIDDDEDAPPKAAKAPSQMKLVIVGAVALFVALVGAQVTGPLLTQMLSGDSAAAASDGEEAYEPEFVEEPLADTNKIEPAFYTPLDPPFVHTFSDGAGGSRFLQLTLQAMARSEKAVGAIKTHAPALRNAFLFLLSKYEVDDLATFEGKEKLRTDMLVVANEIMLENTGDASIAELYFTSLVIQ